MTLSTDFYKQCEQALVVTLRQMTDFFKHEWQVSDDDTNLARGADYFVVYRPGAFPVAGFLQTKRFMDIRWSIIMDIYVRYKTYKDSWDKFKNLRSALFNGLHEDQTLGGNINVSEVLLASDENAQYFKFADTPENATPNFIIQTMSMAIKQRVRVR